MQEPGLVSLLLSLVSQRPLKQAHHYCPLLGGYGHD